MSVWEYKVITSGKGGFASPALMEKFLNDLGKDEWEILSFHTQPENILAFSGLARRPTQRDWTLADAAATAAKAEAEKLRAEFEAKFKGLSSANPAQAAEEKPENAAAEKAAGDDSLRSLRDTESDQDPDAPEEEADEWDKLTAKEEDELPSFFEAIRPHLRRNQRGPGMSVGVDFLAKKWGLEEDDLLGALKECGFDVPEDEDAKPVYLEYDGDLFWVNINRRGEIWVNTKEKPRPVFKVTQAPRFIVEEKEKPEKPAKHAAAEGAESAGDYAAAPAHDSASEGGEAKPANETAPAEPAAPGEPLPAGDGLLAKIRPLMRRNRRGPGGSGSVTFLSRALRCNDADLMAGFATLGLTPPENQNDKAPQVEVGGHIWWLNKDGRGGVWINGREKRDSDHKDKGEAPTSAPTGEVAPEAPAAVTPEAAVAAPTESAPAPASTDEAPASVPAPATSDSSYVVPAVPSSDGAAASAPAPTAETPAASASEAAPAAPAAEAPASEGSDSAEGDAEKKPKRTSRLRRGR